MRSRFSRAAQTMGAALLVIAGCVFLAQPAIAAPDPGTTAVPLPGYSRGTDSQGEDSKGSGSMEGDDQGGGTLPAQGPITVTVNPGSPIDPVDPGDPIQRAPKYNRPQETGSILTSPFFLLAVVLAVVLALALLAGAFVFARRRGDQNHDQDHDQDQDSGSVAALRQPGLPAPSPDYEPVASYATGAYSPAAPSLPGQAAVMPGYDQSSWDASVTGTGPIPVTAEGGSYAVSSTVDDDDLPPEPPSDVRPLVLALEQVAAQGPGDAIRQQIERLLEAGEPSRDILIKAAIKYRDQLEGINEELRSRLLLALGTVGVREVIADGQVLDGRLHEVLTVEPAPSPELADRIARTVRCGYVDVDRVLRVPTVAVYGGAGSSATGDAGEEN